MRRGIMPVLLIFTFLLFFATGSLSVAQDKIGNDQPRPETTTKKPSKLISSEDGWLDVSGFLDEVYGFVPIVMPITEPAVGFGAAGALAFIDKQKAESRDGFGRPNITVAGGLLTENDTKGVMAGDVRHWMDDRLQTLVAGIQSSVNLDFYGVGRDDALRNGPLSYNIEISGGTLQAKYRISDSQYWAGLGYALAGTKVTFESQSAIRDRENLQRDSTIGGLVPSMSYDSRDNIFTPLRGSYAEASVGLFSQAFGSDQEFQRVNLLAMHFWPLHSKLTHGVRGGAALSFGDVPFYLRPFIQLRGAPVMRYQGEYAAQIETELRWQFWQRFSLVGFAGAGAAWNDLKRFDNTTSIVTGGAGFRYEIARKYGLHMGLDVAASEAGMAVYVQFGSAWARP